MKSIGLVVITVVLVAGLAAGEIKDKGWWRNAVFYQVYPRSFKDSNGDGIGDLNGITDKLEHFKDLGVTAIWLSPIYSSPGRDMGYDISNFTEIDSMYGTLEDFKKMVQKAKELGVKVVLDLVPNHTSDKHEWFQKSRNKIGKYADYYIWKKCDTKDGKVIPPNNWVSVFNGTAWTMDDIRKECYFHQFYDAQPDLNYRNQNVKDEMMNVIKYWLDLGIDGFRVDAVPHLFEDKDLKNEALITVDTAHEDDYVTRNHTLTKDLPETYQLVKAMREYIDDYANKNNVTEKVLLTEAYTTWHNTLEYYKYGSDVPFNFKFITDANGNSTVSVFKTIIDNWMAGTPQESVPNWVMGNHDRTRIGARYPGRADQMVMLEMMLPGVAVTYYGEEIGMEEDTKINRPNGDFRDGCRTPFQWDSTTSAGFSTNSTTWLPVNENYKTLNLANEKKRDNSPYNVYKKLLQLRTSPVLREGALNTYVLNNSVLAAVRSNDKDAAVLLINFSKDTVTVDLKNITQHATGTLALGSENSGLTKNAPYSLDSVSIPGSASMILTTNSAGSIAYSIVTLSLAFCVLIFRM